MILMGSGGIFLAFALSRNVDPLLAKGSSIMVESTTLRNLDSKITRQWLMWRSLEGRSMGGRDCWLC